MRLLTVLSDCELRLYLYLSRHQLMYGPSEPVRLADREILSGRFRKGGVRMDGGAGIGSRNRLRKAREGLVERGLLEVRRDQGDAARQRTFYRLVMGSKSDPMIGSDLDPVEGSDLDPPGVQAGHPPGSNSDARGFNSDTRTSLRASSRASTRRDPHSARAPGSLKLDLSEPKIETPLEQLRKGFARVYAERYGRTYPLRASDDTTFKSLLKLAGDAGTAEVIQRATFAAHQAWRDKAVTPGLVAKYWAELIEVQPTHASSGRAVGAAPPEPSESFCEGEIDMRFGGAP